MYGYTTTTGTAVGELASGTVLNPEDKLNSIIKRMVGGTTHKYIIDNTNDTDTFCNMYNHNNGYNGLSLGDGILIKDGTYNEVWEIAGFDCEYSRTASDNTTYNNGYGICLIPKTSISTNKWNNTNTVTGGYMASYMHTSYLVTVANNLKNVLGNHLVLRNVLLSSETNGTDSGYTDVSSNYTWTTSYATLMSVGQCNGKFASHHNKYDDGEANYKLPLFNYESYESGNFWLRNVAGSGYAYRVWAPGVGNDFASYNRAVRPLIYLR